MGLRRLIKFNQLIITHHQSNDIRGAFIMARFTLPRDLYHGENALEALITRTDGLMFVILLMVAFSL